MTQSATLSASEHQNKYIRAWNKFWFTPTSPLPMALFRIIFGIVLLENCMVHLYPDFDIFYLKESIIPIKDMMSLYWHKDPLFDVLVLLPPDDRYMWGAFWVLVGSIVCMILGLFTRVSTWAVYLLLMSFSSHFELNQNAGDNYLRIAALCMALSNCGDAISLDSLFRSFRRDWRIEGLQAPWTAPWAQRLLQIQLCIAYAHTWFCKMEGPNWNDGTAVYYAVRYDDLMRFPIPHFLDQLPIYMVLTWGTLFVEFILWNFIWWRKTRYWVILLGISLHLGIEYTMNLPMFEWVFMFTYLLFVYPEDLTRVWDMVKARMVQKYGQAHQVIYSDRSPVSVKIVSVIASLDIFGRFRGVSFDELATNTAAGPNIAESDLEGQVIVMDKDKMLKGYNAFKYLAWRMPLLWILSPFIHWPLFSLIGQIIFKVFASIKYTLFGENKKYTLQSSQS